MTWNHEIINLETEQQNVSTTNIDECSTLEILEKINTEDQKVANVVRAQLHKIEKLVNAAICSLKKGGRMLYVGAGTSGRLGILDASECPPTYGVSAELVQGLIAGGEKAIFSAQEGAEDSYEYGEQDLKDINLTEKDIVIGLAASGRTPYVLGALSYAKTIGATTGSICCVSNGKVSSEADYPIEIVTGAEVVTGSTRMKAGTAQKLVLNMITTTTMIQLGKVYQNYMVDVQSTNHKLELRAKTMLCTILNINEKEAQDLLTRSQKNVKTAIVMHELSVSHQEACRLLTLGNGHIKEAFGIYEKERIK